MNSPTVELVQFRLKPEVSEAAFLEAVADTQVVVAQLPGFLHREVLKGDDGLWVDVIHWQTKIEALAAAQAFGTMPEVAAFGAMIDPNQMTMLHLEQARTFE